MLAPTVLLPPADPLPQAVNIPPTISEPEMISVHEWTPVLFIGTPPMTTPFSNATRATQSYSSDGSGPLMRRGLPGADGRETALGFTRSRSDPGNPAVVGSLAVRSVVLRPHLSVGFALFGAIRAPLSARSRVANLLEAKHQLRCNICAGPHKCFRLNGFYVSCARRR